ncbi:hypothetical protein SAMN05660461_1845 [Chitinophaga ginsengisegetis]|uniref:Uncharacterized protein n=1 Tax=Chitinophaga ginsengisegetis TaxID=393003 RepID=A0A1T5NJ85_9BACT|nr:DUF6527 family protein [Chitinophaga ginsengisegetis]SKD00515.1 hypothetical protein SAMN05660461_1845 [Chitinophaga ginsengisegetis]
MKKAFLYIWGKLMVLFRKIDYKPIHVTRFPTDFEIFDKTIYIIGHPGFPKWAVMQCPCGCKVPLTLSLMKHKKPNWECNIKNQKATLSPSVWKTDGCKSHFFLRNGKVIWA